MSKQMFSTPSPWKILQSKPYLKDNDAIYEQVQIGQADFVIAEIPFGKTRELHDEAEANARLIAAAPELLEACKMALLELSGINNGQECKVLSQAISKAEVGQDAL